MTRSTAARRPGVLSRLYTGTGAFDIVGRRRTWYLAFGLLVLVCAASMVLRGFNLGIDFTGGTQIQFPARTAAATGPNVSSSNAGIPLSTAARRVGG